MKNMTRQSRRTFALVAICIVGLATTGCGTSVRVPEIIGTDEGYAKGLLIGANLEPVVVEEPVLDVPAGEVLRQTPAPGTEVNEASEVTLVVAVSPEFEIIGTFTLGPDGTQSAGSCNGTGGYRDIKAGLPVTLRDGAGAVLATSRLDNGTRDGRRCTFGFQLPDIPQAEFYAVEVGRRGELTYSFAEMQASDWKVSLTIG